MLDNGFLSAKSSVGFLPGRLVLGRSCVVRAWGGGLVGVSERGKLGSRATPTSGRGDTRSEEVEGRARHPQTGPDLVWFQQCEHENIKSASLSIMQETAFKDWPSVFIVSSTPPLDQTPSATLSYEWEEYYESANSGENPGSRLCWILCS